MVFDVDEHYMKTGNAAFLHSDYITVSYSTPKYGDVALQFRPLKVSNGSGIKKRRSDAIVQPYVPSPSRTLGSRVKDRSLIHNRSLTVPDTDSSGLN